MRQTPNAAAAATATKRHLSNLGRFLMQVWGPLFAGVGEGKASSFFSCVGYLALCDGDFFLQGFPLARHVICAAGEGEVALHSLA